MKKMLKLMVAVGLSVTMMNVAQAARNTGKSAQAKKLSERIKEMQDKAGKKTGAAEGVAEALKQAEATVVAELVLNGSTKSSPSKVADIIKSDDMMKVVSDSMSGSKTAKTRLDTIISLSLSKQSTKNTEVFTNLLTGQDVASWTGAAKEGAHKFLADANKNFAKDGYKNLDQAIKDALENKDIEKFLEDCKGKA